VWRLLKKFGFITPQLNKGKQKMQKNNSLQIAMANARQRHAELELQDEAEQYDNYETTIERLEARGFIDGLEAGIVAGYEYAISVLQDEEFVEHAQILRTQLHGIINSLKVGE
jgi:hypothetical protein